MPFYIPDEDIIFFNERYEQNEFDIMFEELNTFFSQEEILKAIIQLKTNKSGGPDKIVMNFSFMAKIFLRLHYAIYLIRYMKKFIFLKIGLKVM